MASNSMIWIIIAIVVAIGVVAVLAFLPATSVGMRRPSGFARRSGGRHSDSRSARRSPTRPRQKHGQRGPRRRPRRRKPPGWKEQPRPIATPRPPPVRNSTPVASAPTPSTPSEATTRAPKTMSVAPKGPKPGRRRRKRRPQSSSGCDTCRRLPGRAVRRRRHPGESRTYLHVKAWYRAFNEARRRRGGPADSPVDSTAIEPFGQGVSIA